MTAPIVILVRPQMGENIGAVARAMSNFGLSELRIIAPRDGWPNQKALEMSAGGKPIIETAQIFPDFVAGVHDINLAYATTARPRDMEKRVVEPSEAMIEISEMNHSSAKIALIFGPERTGLENEEISWCDTIISIPTAPENWSLNLGQSMVVLGYEWWKTNAAYNTKIAQNPMQHDKPYEMSPPAPKADWEGMFGQLESYLDQAEYFRVSDKKSIMWQNIRTMLLRSQMSEQEVRTFRGMLRLMWEGRPARKKD